ncbi:glycosyltransferase [Salinimicrobium gaetbulicola]|uniref:Glycosyltransferase n=1 Tax=Salinimicrobium gaetbulicola TaxID=999702 RepID=A0ABW3IJM0_9FLAO
MKKVVLHFNSVNHHFSQLITGLEYLNHHRKIDLSYNFDFGKYPENIFRVEISGLNLFFDLADHSKIDPILYRESDFYIKRMLLKKDHVENHKLTPYGLYFPVYYRNPTLKYLFLKDLSYWKYSLKYWKGVSKFLDIRDSIATNELSIIESDLTENKGVIFRSRLWGAGKDHPKWKRENRKALNDQRIRINKLLKEKFGDSFTGGIRKDDFSDKQCPELVLPKKEFHRKRYLKKMQNSSIGIVTYGLEESIGAKFGEYLANGLAIVTNPIDEFQLLGPLKEKEHYFSYHSPEECLEKTQLLFSNDGLRRSMQKANREYYNNWLHPGTKMMKIFERIDLL